MTDPWSADFDDLRVFSLAMQNKLELSVCLSVFGRVDWFVRKRNVTRFCLHVLTNFQYFTEIGIIELRCYDLR